MEHQRNTSIKGKISIKDAAACVLLALLLAAAGAGTAAAGTWVQKEAGLSYRESGGDVTGWKRIADEQGNRAWYYFGEDGLLARDVDTPDGFYVDENGRFAGATENGPAEAFIAAELEKERAQQEYEIKYYEELRRKAAEEEARAAEAAAKAAAQPGGGPGSEGESGSSGAPKGSGGPGASGTAGSSGGPGVAPTEPQPVYVSLFRREKYAELLRQVPPLSLSGQQAGGMPAEFYMLCVAGETSGAADFMNSIVGDSGRAYGLCQYDYRYDLVDFLRYACGQHPQLWAGAEAFLEVEPGDISLVENAALKQVFRRALLSDPDTAISDQLVYMRMLYWDGFARKMDEAGFHLEDRNIAVQAALFSVNVNCGPQAEVFIKALSPDLSDQEFLDRIYALRNTVFAEQSVQGLRKKGTSERYLEAEPEMAADLMYGEIGLDSRQIYGGGVEWYGNPF